MSLADALAAQRDTAMIQTQDAMRLVHAMRETLDRIATIAGGADHNDPKDTDRAFGEILRAANAAMPQKQSAAGCRRCGRDGPGWCDLGGCPRRVAQKRTAKDFVLSQRPLCECRRHLGDSHWFIWDRAMADRITGYAKSPISAWRLAMDEITRTAPRPAAKS